MWLSALNRNRAALTLTLFFLHSALIMLGAQDLEPRILSPIPAGGNFAVASYGYSSGNILLDNSLPIEDLKANLNNLAVGYARSFSLATRLAKFDVVVPFSFAHFTGVVNSVDSSTSRTGFGDPLFRLSLVLIGNRAMKTEEFMKAEQKKFNLGLVVRVRPPLGQYDPQKLINLGTNRWSTKLGVAASYSFRQRFILEGHFYTWLYSENSAFFNGNVLQQKPLFVTQLHATYVFKPGAWLAVSVGRSFSGETVVNGIEKNDERNAGRLGAAFSYRLSQHNALKIAVTSGLSTRYGADFTSLLIAYQYLWFDKKQHD
jgi:hypothetical protein